MSNNFGIKYAAVAAAVTAACASGFAAAATISTVGYQNISNQGIAAAATGSDFTPNSFTVILGAAAYATTDTVSVSISGASFNATTATGTAAASTRLVCTGGSGGTGATAAVLSFLSKTSSAVTYKILEVNTFTAATCAFTGSNFSISLSGITAGTSSISLGYQANLNGGSVPYDQALTPSFHIGGTRNQFTTSSPTTGFTGTVDVSAARQSWTSGRTQTLTLSYGSNASDTAALANASVTVASNVYGATGTRMFSFLDDAGAGCTNAELTAGPGSAAASSGSLTVTSDCATLTLTNTGIVGSTAAANPTITLSKATTSTGLAIPDGVFSVQTTYSVAGTTVAQATTAVAAGSFSINGTSIVIPYMPYGTSGTSAITQSYYIMNQSTTAGIVTGSAQNQAGVTCNLGTVGTAAARSVTNLSAAINDKIAACYATAGVYPDGTRVFVELTSNTPVTQTVVNTTYNVGGSSRVNVTNNSNRVRND